MECRTWAVTVTRHDYTELLVPGGKHTATFTVQAQTAEQARLRVFERLGESAYGAGIQIVETGE